MKKTLAALLAALLLLGCTACERRDQRTTKPSEPAGHTPAEGEMDGDGEEPEPDAPDKDPVAEGDAREVELAVRDCMAALKTGTRDNIDMYIDYDSFLDLEEGTPDDNLRALLKRLDYEITGSEVEGEFATVTVSVSNIDMHAVLGDYLRDAMDLEYNAAAAGTALSEEQMESEYLQLFVDYLDRNSENRREITIEIPVGKVDGWWRVQPDANMRAAVLGDYFEASKSVGLNAGGGSR